MQKAPHARPRTTWHAETTEAVLAGIVEAEKVVIRQMGTGVDRPR